ncbi:MAG: cupin domain-containing protein, partial [Lachnospiraceae bacterium]|nr:cupin domain-containing protein [Lachnospiraceae bacterium]
VDGIRISFEELIYPEQESVLIIDNDKLPLLKSEEGAYEIRSIFPYDRHRNFEVYEIKIEPGEGCEFFLKKEGSSEYIIVVQGVLTLETTEGTYEIAANHAIKLDASKHHSYHNSGNRQLILNFFV